MAAPKMKKKDKIEEFDFSKLSENMTTVMKYVMAYFNEYLSMESCDAEVIKIKHITDKLKEETANKHPQEERH